MIRTRAPRLAAGAIGCVVMRGNRPTTHTHHIELHRRPAACLLASAASGAAQRVEHRDDQCGEGEEAGHSGLLGERVSITIGLMTHPATIFPGGDPDAVARCSAMLRGGGLVGMPTETVYGLACDALNPRAVAGVFAAKERPSFDPLIVHVRDLAHAQALAVFDGTATVLAKRFWPGALTMVLPKKDVIPDIVTSGMPTVAVRMSGHPVMKEICKVFGKPIAAPSANRFGRISPTSASAVMKELGGKIPLIIDGGACNDGLESTIIRVEVGEKRPQLHLLRAGPVVKEQLQKIGKVIRKKKPRDVSEAPGQLESHYAPAVPLYIFEKPEDFRPDEGKTYGLLSYRGQAKDGYMDLHDWEVVEELSPGKGKLAEASVRLFHVLRLLDESGVDAIVAETVSETGLGVAINDRLRRASVTIH